MSDFDWNDVTEFYSWMKRPAVIVSPNLGVLEGWYAVSPDNNWSRVYPIELQQHGEAMTKKDFYNTFSDYIKIPSPTKSSTTRKDFRIDWESLDKSMENITPESWQKARDDLDWEHNHPRTLMSRSYGYQEAYIKAWSFATAAHQGQKVPSTDYPYINHIGLVAMEALSTIANEEEIDNPELLIQCALLHDTIEDTDCSHADLKREFGSDVADGVLSLSKDATLTTKAERMNDCLLRIKLQPKEIWMVKLCDRITNLQPPPKHWDIKKIRAYRYEAELILKELGEANEYLAKRLSRKIENYKSHLNQPEELFVQSFGCPECHKPAESLAKFDDMPLQKVVTLHDKSHHSFWISECKHCRQPYLEEFEDDIDWSGGGDDPMWHFWMPLTEDEHDTLTEDYVDLDLLSSIMRKRKFLILDSNSKFKWSSE